MTTKTATESPLFRKSRAMGDNSKLVMLVLKQETRAKRRRHMRPSATACPLQTNVGQGNISSSINSTSSHLFVPVKTAKKERQTQNFKNVVSESLNVIKDITNNDSTQEESSIQI